MWELAAVLCDIKLSILRFWTLLENIKFWFIRTIFHIFWSISQQNKLYTEKQQQIKRGQTENNILRSSLDVLCSQKCPSESFSLCSV